MSESHSDWSECNRAGTEVAADGRGAVTFGAERGQQTRQQSASTLETSKLTSRVPAWWRALTDLDLNEVLLSQRLARDGVARVLVCSVENGKVSCPEQSLARLPTGWIGGTRAL